MNRLHLTVAVFTLFCLLGSTVCNVYKYHVLLVTTDMEAQPLILQLSDLLSVDHRVTAVTYGGKPPPPPTSVTVRHVRSVTDDPSSSLSWTERWERHILLTPDSVVASRVAGCRALRSSGALKDLKPDLIIATLYLDDACLLPLLPTTTPIVGLMTSAVGLPWVVAQLGGHFPVARMSVHGYPLSDADFYGRLWNGWRWWQVQRQVQKQYQTPIVADGAGHLDLQLAYEERIAAVYMSGDPRVEKDVPSDHRLRFLGCIECNTFEQLPEAEMKALGGPGVLVLRLQHPYISLPESFTQALATGLAATSLMTIDISDATVPGSPRIVHSAAPAADALAHPRARVFISECSSASVLLAVHFSVPTICIPFTAGQKHATNRAVAVGLGIELDRRAVTADSVRAAVASATGSGGLRRAVRTRADALRHEVVPAAASFAHDVQHLLMFGKQRRQRRPIGLVEYYCLDVIGTCLVSGGMLAFMLLLMFACVYKAMTTRVKEDAKEE